MDSILGATTSGTDHDVSLETIRSWWKVPAIAHFCSLFRSTFTLPDFEIEELEEALYQDCEADASNFLVDLLTALLKGSFETKKIDESNYCDYLRQLCNEHWEKENRVNPLNNEDTCFQGLSTLMKVEILFTLCDYRLDASDVSVLKDYDGEALRVDPLGHDAKGASYWYFYGTRLYREDPPPPVAKAEQKKRKKKKKRCFLQALRRNLACQQMLLSDEEEEKIPETTPEKKRKKAATLKEEKEKGKQKRRSNSAGGVKQGRQNAESGSDDEDNLPLAGISSLPKKGRPKKTPAKDEKSLPIKREKKGKEEQKKSKVSTPVKTRKKMDEGKPLRGGKNENVSGDRAKRRGRSSCRKGRNGESVSLDDMRRSDEMRGSRSLSARGAKRKGSERDFKEERNGKHSNIGDLKGGSRTTCETSQIGQNKRKDSNGKGKGRKLTNKQESKEDDNPAPVKKCKMNEDLWSNEESSSSESSDEEPEPAKWQVVCVLEEDWQQLTESLKKSKIRCEKELYQVLSENFMPEIHSLFIAKERELRRKLQELAPKRISSRIAGKKTKQEEEEKLKALMEYEEEQKRKAEEASRLLAEEEERIRSRNRDREERLAMRNNLSAKQKKKALYNGFKKVLETLKSHPEAWPFMEPVQESFAPAYYDIIQHPMDINTVEVKVQEEMYKSKAKFVSDVELIFSNCVEYNGPESEYTLMGGNVASCFQEALDQHFPPGSTSDSELSDIASDQDSAYRLSYPRELRRRRQALDYTEIESTSDSGDTCKDEEEDKSTEMRVFPSYLSDKKKASTSEEKESNKGNREKADGLLQESSLEVSVEKDSKSPLKHMPSSVRSDSSQDVTTANDNTKSLPKPQRKSPAKTKSANILAGKKDSTKCNPKKKESSEQTSEHVDNKLKKLKGKSTKLKKKLKEKNKCGEKGLFGSFGQGLPNSFKSDIGNSEMTSLQKLEAITDKLGPCIEEQKKTAGDRMSTTPSHNSPGKEGCNSLQETGNEKVETDKSNELHNTPVSSAASEAAISHPALKLKSETNIESCSQSQSDLATKPQVASPLVVSSNLATLYNPLNLPSSSRTSRPVANQSNPSLQFVPIGGSSVQPSGDNTSQKGERDAPRSLIKSTKHTSAFQSVGNDNGAGRTRLEQQSILQASPQGGQYNASPYYFGSPLGNIDSQATTSKTSDSSSLLLSTKNFPVQPIVVRPVSRYPPQAQPLRHNQYLQASAVTNPSAGMGPPQLNILQIASAPSLTLNIQPSTLMNNSQMMNVTPDGQSSIYGQHVGAIDGIMQTDLHQKPTLVMRYQTAPGGPYNSQYRPHFS